MHDELVVLCDEEQADIAAWLLNVAHLWVWAFSNEAMELYDMCAVGMFFDDVMVQRAFRKSATLKTTTPSNPDEDMPDGRVLLEWAMPELNDLVYELGIANCPELYGA